MPGRFSPPMIGVALTRRLLPAAAVLAVLAFPALPAPPGPLSVVDVRHWSFDGATRIAIEVSGDFQYRADTLSNPERLFFDITGAQALLGGQPLRGIATLAVSDALVEQIRVAQTLPDVTRVVLDLRGPVEWKASELANPNRLMVEVRLKPAPPVRENPVASAPEAAPGPAAPARGPVSSAPGPSPGSKPPPATRSAAKTEPAPPRTAPPAANRPASETPGRPTPVQAGKGADPAPAASPKSKPDTPAQTRANSEPAAAGRREPVLLASAERAPAPLLESVDEGDDVSGITSDPAKTSPGPPAASYEPAARTARGSHSLMRAMGLKIGRIVLDPGHGGHDTGTISASGLLEKDLVLDISRRLGALIEEQLGMEVLYTRTDDTFVPLGDRTRIANEQKADLFVSLHLNSSKIPSVAGAETFYLNFTDSSYSLEISARENANSNKPVHELQDLLKQIALNDKVEESREFASKVQSAMHRNLSAAVRSQRNRGVKKAPFVVLIGASMPSVLVEMGFLSNSREESLVQNEEHRQKMAQALLEGITGYLETLGQRQVAQRLGDGE